MLKQIKLKMYKKVNDSLRYIKFQYNHKKNPAYKKKYRLVFFLIFVTICVTVLKTGSKQNKKSLIYLRPWNDIPLKKFILI